MEFIQNIRTVARYEAKTLRRSWFFRLFFILSLFIFVFMNIGLFSPIGNQSWNLISLPAALPFANLYVLNIGQSIVVIFLAADFLKRDKKVDTNEVLYTRSMSNLEYILGKTWGILKLFLGVNLIVLLIGLVINIINKEMSIDLIAYIDYILLISIPTIIFSLGLAFMLMLVLKNQAITFLILLGLAMGNMIWGYYRLGGIFDYMAFGIPMLKSRVTGFDNLPFLISQRGLYFFLGMGLIFSTILLFNRLPQSLFHYVASWVFMIIFITGAGICGTNFFITQKTIQDQKYQVIETNKKYEESLFVSVTNVNIDISHMTDTISATAKISFINNNEQDLYSYLFSLNPYLTVHSVSSGEKEITFTSTNHIIEISPATPLGSGGSDSVTISYSGSINEHFCYPDFTDNPRDNPYRIEMLSVNKRQAFLSEEYLLLTPETHWYPVAGLNYYPTNPGKLKIDFANYSLKVATSGDLTAVSQGKGIKEGQIFTFEPETPLSGLTLAIGNYRTDMIVVDSITYINNYLEGNDYYKSSLAEIADTLPSLITGYMRDLEINFTTSYPFPTLSFLEVPIQFYSYPRLGTQTRSELQPSLVLLPEKLTTMQNAGFDARFKRQKRRMERNNEVVTDKELKVRLFNDFITNSFISGNNFRYVNGQLINEPTRYRLGPSFYFFKNNFYSREYPIINAVFETHLQKLEVPQESLNYGGATNNITDNDLANMLFKEYSFSELLKNKPIGDTLDRAISLKGDYLFSILRAKAGIGDFNDWMKTYIEQNKFRSISIEKFNSDVKDKFGFEFYSYLDSWFYGKEQPGFLFANFRVSEIVVDNRVRYQITFVAHNPEPVSGLFSIAFNTSSDPGGQPGPPPVGGGGRESVAERGMGMESRDISGIVILEPDEVKEIGIILDAQPRAMLVNTLFSQNIPGQISFPINEITNSKSLTNGFSGERILTEFPVGEEPGVIVVDNEDPGFSTNLIVESSPLRRLLKVSENRRPVYDELRTRTWAIPEYWQAVLQNTYYGKYVLSSVYTRAGGGDKMLTWTTDITEPGLYQIYCYVGKTIEGSRQGVTGGSGIYVDDDNATVVITVGEGGNRPESDETFKDMHYQVYHADGVDEIVFDYSGASGGWNSFGNFYLSPGEAKVTLSNLSEGNIVIGDAIKWIKID